MLTPDKRGVSWTTDIPPEITHTRRRRYVWRDRRRAHDSSLPAATHDV